MLLVEDRRMLQDSARHALDFIFEHCNDTQFCTISGFLINGMRELCEEEQREFLGPSQLATRPAYPSLSSPPMINQTQAEELLRQTVAREMQRHTARASMDQMGAEDSPTPVPTMHNGPR